MPTKSLLLGKLINNDGTVTSSSIGTIDASQLSADIPLGTEDYSTANDLPAAGNQIGDQAFVSETNRLYIWTGAGWYNIALINQTPTWDSGGLPEAAYELDSIGGSATSIVLSATDPDGLAIQWTYSITDSGNDLATISNDSNGTFTITAKSLADILSAGYDSAGGTFDVTFRASDGVNLATALSEFTISFAAGGTQAQGSNYGYATVGYALGDFQTFIEKFSFSSDGNATNVGNMTVARHGVAGQSSTDNGYASGGQSASGVENTIDKFPFAADGNATDVGDLSVARRYTTGQSSSESGYTSGGTTGSNVNTIDKFSFATDGNAIDVGDLVVAMYAPAGQSSTENGYTAGGQLPTHRTAIQKFPFATDANATYIADLVQTSYAATGQSSTDNGYASGGYAPGTHLNVIQKFPFATDGNSTDVGDLTEQKYFMAGQSSTENGYTAGGSTPVVSTIEKFPFATDANATDIGDLTTAGTYAAGQQY